MSSMEKAAAISQIKSTEKIFMVEVMIQKLNLDMIEITDFEWARAETCMSYKFLDHGPFKICEEDFKGSQISNGCVGCGPVRNGTSTMFPLFPEQIEELRKSGFNIDVEIIKNLRPIPKTIAKTVVSMAPIFGALFDTMLKQCNETAAKSMKQRYKLADENRDPVGYVDLFIRLSCLGKMIVTKFQMDMSHECIEFHSNSDTVYKYRKKVFPDPYICKPCGQSKKNFPAYEKVPTVPHDFPRAEITDDMKNRLLERRKKEIENAAPVSS